MTQTRSTCIIATLLLLAVSLTYGGYTVIRGSQTRSEITARGLDSTAPSASPAVRPSLVASASSSASASLGTTEVQALDTQLKAIINELESLGASGDSGDGAIGDGLE